MFYQVARELPLAVDRIARGSLRCAGLVALLAVAAAAGQHLAGAALPARAQEP